jgi:hypothetical protein
MTFTVRKGNLTVPEVVLLRALHGEDAIVDIRPLGTSKRTLKFERDRLLTVYGKKQDIIETIHKIFSNTAVQGLETLEDIGVDPTTRPAPRPKATARVLTIDDLKPYDPNEDVELQVGDSDVEFADAEIEPQPELEVELDAEIEAAEAAGREAAMAMVPKPRRR